MRGPHARRALLAKPPLPSGWRLLIVGGVAYCIVLIVVVALRAESSSDFRDFWRTAEAYRTTGEIRPDLGVHNYLPFFVIFMTPWSLLPLPVAIGAFSVFSMVLLGVTVAMLELLLNGRVDRAPRAATLISLALALPYIHATAVLGQVNLLVLFLIVAAWLLASRGQEWSAGVPLGLAALIKVLPAGLLVLFLLQRRWRVAVAAGATCALLGLGLPLASLGWRETVRLHGEYYQRAAVEHSAITTLLADKPIKAKYTNNSTPIVLRRLLSRTNGDPSDNGGALFVNVADVPRPAIVAVYAVLMAALLGGGLVQAIRRAPHWPFTSAGDFSRGSALFGAWCALLVLASPLVWTHYLVLAYPALAALADRLERERLERKRLCRITTVALACWSVGILLLVWPAARAAGAQLAAVIVVWVALTIRTPRGNEG
jgi:hypothetical protein